MNHKKASGQSLFEVLIALLIIGVIVVALVGLTTASIKNASFSRNKELSTRFSQGAIEWLRAQRDASWDAFFLKAQNTSWCIDTDPPAWPGTAGTCSGTKIVDTIFEREVTFTIISPANVQTDVAVTWTDSLGLHEVKAVTTLSDPREL